MVPGAGIEPARYFYRGILSPLRLPISPPGLRGSFFIIFFLTTISVVLRLPSTTTPPGLRGSFFIIFFPNYYLSSPTTTVYHNTTRALGLNQKKWRLRAESNRRRRLCRPLHDHSATQPLGRAYYCKLLQRPKKAPTWSRL